MKKFNKYKKLFKEKPEEGLKVFGTTPIDLKKIGDVVKSEGFYAEWNKIGKFWFFPELRKYYDSLELELMRAFDRKNIDYYVEGV